jgi:hypothetical protein
MNHNETGFLQRAIEDRRSFAIPVRALVRRKGKHPFPTASSDAYAEKKNKRPLSPSAYLSGLRFQIQSPITSLAGERCFVYWFAFYSTLEDR